MAGLFILWNLRDLSTNQNRLGVLISQSETLRKVSEAKQYQSPLSLFSLFLPSPSILFSFSIVFSCQPFLLGISSLYQFCLNLNIFPFPLLNQASLPTIILYIYSLLSLFHFLHLIYFSSLFSFLSPLFSHSTPFLRCFLHISTFIRSPPASPSFFPPFFRLSYFLNFLPSFPPFLSYSLLSHLSSINVSSFFLSESQSSLFRPSLSASISYSYCSSLFTFSKIGSKSCSCFPSFGDRNNSDKRLSLKVVIRVAGTPIRHTLWSRISVVVQRKQGRRLQLKFPHVMFLTFSFLKLIYVCLRLVKFLIPYFSLLILN